MRYDCIPACVYTFPEVAVVGSSRDSAKERGIDAVQAVAKFAANGKALGEGEADGFVQVVAEKGTGRIVGCQIVGPHAVEIIHEVAVAMAHELTVSRARRDGSCAPHRQRGHQVRDGGCGDQGRSPGEQLEHGLRARRRESKRLPEWLRRPIAQPGSSTARHRAARASLSSTPCARAPSVPIVESASRAGTATFLIMGDACTRTCRFCAVEARTPGAARSQMSRVAWRRRQRGWGSSTWSSRP